MAPLSLDHPMDTTAELQLHIDRLRAGNAKAVDALIDRAYDRLQHLASKMLADFPRVRDREQTGDVLHDAYVRLRAALSGTDISDVRAFFRMSATVIRRQLIDLHRHHFGPEGSGAHRAGTAANSSTAAGAEKGDLTHEPARLASWAEFHQKVEALPEDEREVFDLLWYQDLTQDEAAAVAGVSLATLKRRWLSARLRIQEVLRDFAGQEVSG